MVDIKAEIICDSVGEHSPRLTTFLVRYPKFIHAEHMRHRSGSYCVSSSRAIPVSKNLQEVRDDALRAGAVYWGAEQKGMQSGGELPEDQYRDLMYDLPRWADPDFHDGIVNGERRSLKDAAKFTWKHAALSAANYAEFLQMQGVHKSIVNRLLEPFLHVNVLWTTCEPGLRNFFGLRLDKAAQPEIRALAEQVWRAWNESEPQRREPGDWHLPFVDQEAEDVGAGVMSSSNFRGIDFMNGRVRQDTIKISVARCARLSYTSFETGKRSTVEEDLALYDRLITSRPIHASPAEHQATPDDYDEEYVKAEGQNIGNAIMLPRHPHLHGNLTGWQQFRKMLSGEAVAELPEGYSYGG